MVTDWRNHPSIFSVLYQIKIKQLVNTEGNSRYRRILSLNVLTLHFYPTCFSFYPIHFGPPVTWYIYLPNETTLDIEIYFYRDSSLEK